MARGRAETAPHSARFDKTNVFMGMGKLGCSVCAPRAPPFLILVQADHPLEILIMLFRFLFWSLFWHLKVNSGRERRDRSHYRQVTPRRAGRPRCYVPRLEALEDRTVL